MNPEIKDTTPLPPTCDVSYQRRLLRAFESNVPNAICRLLSETVAQIVTNHLEHIPYDQELSETELRALLSTINSEIDLKISRQNERFWKSLLGNGDGLPGGHIRYVNDTLKEARRILGTQSWHLLVVNSVKTVLKSQLPVLKEACKSVIAEAKPPEKNKIEDPREEPLQSDDDEGTIVEAEGTLCPGTGNVSREFRSADLDDNESDASDNSAYDYGPLPQRFSGGALPRDARPLSPDTRDWTAADRSRLVAEGSLEPLEFSDCEETFTYDTSSFSLKGTAINEGPKSYLPVRSVPLRFGGNSVVYPTSEKNKQPVGSLEMNGIPLVRWATKLGKRGKDILTQEMDVLEDVKKAFSSQKFFLDVFASGPVTTLPRSQEEAAPRFCNHS